MCGFNEQGQSRMVEMWSMATLLFARTLSMLGEGAGEREAETEVQEVNRTCRLCSVVKARLMQSCWRWWCWWWSELLLEMVAQPKEGDEALVLQSWTLKYDWRSSSQANI